MNKKELVAQVVTAIYSLFERRATQADFCLWEEGLEDLETHEIQSGRKRLVKEWSSAFAPTPAQFRELCLSPEGANADTAGEKAWNIAISAIKKYGTGYSVIFADPRIAYAIESTGGWGQFGQQKESDPWVKKEFLRVYGAGRPLAGARIKFLVGEFDRQNSDYIRAGTAEVYVAAIGFDSAAEKEQISIEYVNECFGVSWQDPKKIENKKHLKNES